MLDYLRETKDVEFFTSLATLMANCSVLDLDTFERCMKAEVLGRLIEKISLSLLYIDIFIQVLERMVWLVKRIFTMQILLSHSFDFVNYYAKDII
jgi:hypothetical protein